MQWTTARPDVALLKKAGYQVFEFAQYRTEFIEPAARVGTGRKSLGNAAAAALNVFATHPAIAILDVPLHNYWDVRAVYGYLVEPAYRHDCSLIVHADRDLDDLSSDKFIDPEFGYAWTLERLRHLSARYRRRSLDASRPPMTPIEEQLLEAMTSVGLAPRSQYGIGPYRPDFAFPERLLCVEADGRGWHDAQRDQRRDASLRQQGWEVIRFTGSAIFRDAPACAGAVAKAYRARPEAPDYTSMPSVEVKKSWFTRLLEWIRGLFTPRHDGPAADVRREHVVQLHSGEWCDDLDASQRDAVLSHEGVVQVIAPAGSGKTRVLVSRVRELVSRGVPEERILCTTFNRATETELRVRLEQVGVSEATVRTFHSIGRFILEHEGRLRASIGTLTYAQWRRLSSLAKGEEEGRVWIDAPEAAEAVGKYKLGDMIDPAEAWERADTPTEKTAARVYALYEEELERLDRNDFDDLVIDAVRLLRSEPRVRAKWQEKWECLLVDEYQDIEPAQELLIQLLAAPEDCLMVVGDEDQCIYTWRRAEVERIINLDKRYPGLKRSVLSTCYRCPTDVVGAASTLIQNNKRRFPKVIQAGRLPAPGSSFVRPQPEAEGPAASVVARLRSCDPSATVVMARTSRLLRDIALACIDAGIPIKASGKVLRPAESERVVLAYMRLLAEATSASADDVDEVFRVPNRYLPNGREHHVAQRLRAGHSFAESVSELTVEEWRHRKLVEGAEFLDRAKGASDAARLLHLLRTDGGLDKHYSDKERMSAHDQIEMDVLDALETEFSGLSLGAAVEIMAKRAQALDNVSSDDGVELTTIHGAKGREWKSVILYGWDRDQLPHMRGLEEAKTQEDREKFIEDERRLAYVALTRSTGTVEIIVAKAPESQFSAEAGLSVTAPSPKVHSSPPRPPITPAPSPSAPVKKSTQAAKPRRTGKLMRSKYDNTCAVCNRPVKVGDWICPVQHKGASRWVHARCAEG